MQMETKGKINPSERIPLKLIWEKKLADIHTPVGLYLKLRDRFPQTLLLESADYHGKENALSFLCLDPWAEFKVEDGKGSIRIQDSIENFEVSQNRKDLTESLGAFLSRFVKPENPAPPVMSLGAFGFLGYDALSYFEDIHLSEKNNKVPGIPTALYRVFRFVLVFDHFNENLYFVEQFPEGGDEKSRLPELEALIGNRNIAEYPFRKMGEEWGDQSDEAYLEAVAKGRQHCFRGDVFQIVLSRKFSQAFHGDDFNVYRQLRSINPSPYLFYFDYGSFRIFGSSPEAQIVIRKNKATIYPIAGTFRRTGNDEADAQLAEKLLHDEKENAEHIMLVDLARNDLSRSCSTVEVESLKEVQFYSHVIHLVSKVTGVLAEGVNKLQLVADTFPAGTLSGAPKYRAMELIEEIEPSERGFYAGCIGFIDFNLDFNHAIMIRSFLSKDNRLYFQAGAGVVAKSDPELELKEVANKLSALRTAIDKASDISSF
jgi:anthranilate synthase component 1